MTSKYKTSLKDYSIKELLGVGSYGKVYRVIANRKYENKIKLNQKNNTYSLVLKQISLFNMKDNEINEVKKEAKLLSSINSKYIVKYTNSWIENNCLNIIMEFCKKGDLSKLLKIYKEKNLEAVEKLDILTNNSYNYALKEEKIWYIFSQLCIGIHYLHSKKILHRDLKTQNILITDNNIFKIGDLGVAKVLSHTTFAKTFVGTPYYLSPEICEEKPYNEKSDIWALGCCVYQMATFNHPFNAQSQPALILKILKDNYLPISDKYSNELKSLIALMLEKDHFKRPKISDIIKNDNFIFKCKQYNLYDEIMYETGLYNNIDKVNKDNQEIIAASNKKFINKIIISSKEKKISYNLNNKHKISEEKQSIVNKSNNSYFNNYRNNRNLNSKNSIEELSSYNCIKNKRNFKNKKDISNKTNNQINNIIYKTKLKCENNSNNNIANNISKTNLNFVTSPSTKATINLDENITNLRGKSSSKNLISSPNYQLNKIKSVRF